MRCLATIDESTSRRFGHPPNFIDLTVGIFTSIDGTPVNSTRERASKIVQALGLRHNLSQTVPAMSKEHCKLQTHVPKITVSVYVRAGG